MGEYIPADYTDQEHKGSIDCTGLDLAAIAKAIINDLLDADEFSFDDYQRAESVVQNKLGRYHPPLRLSGKCDYIATGTIVEYLDCPDDCESVEAKLGDLWLYPKDGYTLHIEF